MSENVLIIGAGQGGLAAAEALRSEGFAGAITLLGDEAELPYNRPPLSKAYLLGDATEAQVTTRSAEVLARKNIALRTGCGVEQIDRAGKQLVLADGERLAYDKLIVATGARPRPLPIPGGDLNGVHSLRTLDDARQLAQALPQVDKVVVIGGGFIGLEFAAVARKLGKEVTVVEAADRLMPRVMPPLLSQFFLDLHRAHGTRILLGQQVSHLEGSEDRVRAVVTADGTSHAADLVLVGIGALVNQELGEACGLECANGIVVDDQSRTSDPNIFAVGDCTVRHDANGQWLRLESVQNAVEQAKSAAAAIVGKQRPFKAAPWFWSDQYDVKLQMVGRSQGHDFMEVRGEIAIGKEGKAPSFSIHYFRQDELIGVDTVNCPQEHMQGRKLLDATEPTTLADWQASNVTV